jgi:prephenate dehydrogenase
MDTVAIFGVGLIGGSFGLALRSAGFTGPILGVSSAATIAQALDLGIISEGVSLEEACSRADLIYLAQPIRQIIDVLPRIAPHLRSGQLVTDAGSTKVQIVETAGKFISRATFLGGHPMAGKEVRGVSAADASLFRDRPYLITPSHTTDLQNMAVIEFLDYVRLMGANPVILDAAEHDRSVAYISHLPQLISTALANLLAGVPRARDIAGPAVLDSTRLALSPYEVWRDILETNPAQITAAIDEMNGVLLSLKQQLTMPGMEQMFEQAAVVARSIRKK